jgi:hypothetical protein
MARSIGYKDQDFGGSWNAHKHWKKLREKHRRHIALGLSGPTTPEIYTPSGAGKGDMQRGIGVPEEIYALNYDYAFGKITKKEHEQKVNEFWEQFNQ